MDPTPPPRTESTPAPDHAVRSVHRLQPGPDGSDGVDRLAALAARIVGAPSALICLVADDVTVAGSSGLPALLEPHSSRLAESLATLAVRRGRAVAIPDARADPRADLPYPTLREHVGSFVSVPMHTDGGQVTGALSVFDSSPRVWAQPDVLNLQQLAAAATAELELVALGREYGLSRARWDLAIEAAGIGNFDWDLRTGQLLWDDALIALFGYDGDEKFGQTIDDFTNRLHVDDRPHVGQALELAIANVGDYEAEYRVVLPDGRTRWVQARGRALGRDGIAERLLGAAWDVSATRGARDRAAQIVAAMPVGYLSLDTATRVLAVNNIAERMLHRTRAVLIGQSLRRSVPAAVGDVMIAACVRVARTVQPENVEVQLPDGTWLEAGVWPDPDGVAVYLTDVTARKLNQEAIERSAHHDKSVAMALQDALLTQLPQPDDLVLDARYLTFAAQERVGGDWYDAISQPTGATVVTVGDVVGHDIAAAGIMGQLRTMLRTFAWEHDDSPAAIMTRLDRAMHDLYPGAMATAVTARFDPAGLASPTGARLMRWTNAGHPPPIVLRPDGTTEVLERPIDLLLGVEADLPRGDHTVELDPDSVVVIYTDGVVERRDEAVDVGIDRLAGALRRHRELPLGELLGAVLADAVATQPGDDVAILAVQIKPPR